LVVHASLLALGFISSTAISESRLKKIINAEKNIVVPKIMV
jgi:hypothetical protein